MMMNSANGLLGARSVEAIAGAGSLFSQPGGLSADGITAQLASVIPLDLLPGPTNSDPAPQLPNAVEAVTDIAGLTGATSMAALLAGGGTGAATAIQPGTVIKALGHSLTDLGHDSGQTLGADVTKLPGEVTGLNDTSGNVADAVYNLGAATVSAGQFVNDVSETVSGAGDRSLTETANKAVLDFHLLVEFATHDIGLTHVAHGVTNLGEAIGLGKIGAGDNLVTDIVGLPGTVLSGGDVIGSVAHLTDHLGEVTNGISGIVNAIPLDLGSDTYGLGLLGPDGIVGGSGLDLGRVGDILSPAGGGPLGAITGLVDNATNVLDLVGSNSDGSGNLVTDVLKLPGEVLSGSGTPSLTNAGHHLDVTLTAAGDLVEGVLGAGAEGAGNSPNGLIESIGQNLDEFGNTGGVAAGIPLTVAGLVTVTEAATSGGGAADAGGLVAGIGQTVQGALTDMSNDVAQAGLGGGADSLVGSLTELAGGTGGSPLAPVTALLEGEGGGSGLIGAVTALLGQDHHEQPGYGGGQGLGLGLL